MRISTLVLLSICLFSTLAEAQDVPWWELHEGYQFNRADTAACGACKPTGLQTVSGRAQMNLNGWDFSVQENMANWWGGIFDASGVYGTHTADVTQTAISQGLITTGSMAAIRTRLSTYTFTFGPQFTYRKKRMQPFVRMMVGGAYGVSRVELMSNNALLASGTQDDSSLAVIGGGGGDYVWKNYMAFRVAADYVHTTLFHSTQHNIRLSIGVSFRIHHE